MEEIIFIDANIFLEVFLGDDKADHCKDFINRMLSSDVRASTSDFIIYTCLLQIQHKLKSLSLMTSFVLFINELKLRNVLEIIRPELTEIHAALSGKFKLDFDDSLVVSCMISNGIDTLLSFDRHFDKVHGIKRVEP